MCVVSLVVQWARNWIQRGDLVFCLMFREEENQCRSFNQWEKCRCRRNYWALIGSFTTLSSSFLSIRELRQHTVVTLEMIGRYGDSRRVRLVIRANSIVDFTSSRCKDRNAEQLRCAWELAFFDSGVHACGKRFFSLLCELFFCMSFVCIHRFIDGMLFWLALSPESNVIHCTSMTWYPNWQGSHPKSLMTVQFVDVLTKRFLMTTDDDAGIL